MRYELKKDELLKGELSAVTYDFGIYTIRIANRIFHDSQTLNGCYRPGSKNPEPASEEEIRSLEMFLSQPTDYSYRRATEVSVRCRNSRNTFKTVCYCSDSRTVSWTEGLGFVRRVKKHIFSPDKSSVLYICKIFYGNSNTIKYWYAVYPEGKIKNVVSDNFIGRGCKKRMKGM